MTRFFNVFRFALIGIDHITGVGIRELADRGRLILLVHFVRVVYGYS